MNDEQTPDNPTPYFDDLSAVDAANAIRAARLNALDLLDTAEVLYTLKRFSHSVALSTLVIEEAAKTALLIMIFLEIGGDRKSLWKSYRSHRAKTAWLNPIIERRVRATFPQIPREMAKWIGKQGPTPEQLETSKQRAIYSDCLKLSGDFVAHSPKLVEWRKDAWERLCDAQAVALALRDYPPRELEIWRKHVAKAKNEGKDVHLMLPELHEELLAQGFVEEGWWDGLLKDAEHEAPQSRRVDQS